MDWKLTLACTGADKMQKSMTGYVKWMCRRGDVLDDKERGLPVNYLGRTMVAHGEDFEPDSEFGSCLIGRFAQHCCDCVGLTK